MTRLVFNVKPLQKYIFHPHVSIPTQLRATRLICSVEPLLLLAVDALAPRIRLLYTLVGWGFLLRRRQGRGIYDGFLLQIRGKDIYHTVCPENHHYCYRPAKNESSPAHDGRATICSKTPTVFNLSSANHGDPHRACVNWSKVHTACNVTITVHADSSSTHGKSSAGCNGY